MHLDEDRAGDEAFVLQARDHRRGRSLRALLRGDQHIADYLAVEQIAGDRSGQ